MKLSILVLIVIQVIMIAHTVAENASNRNTSLLFDGVDDYVRVNDSAILNFAKESFTVAVWAKSGKNNRVLLDKGRTASPYLDYSITYGGITNDLISFSVRDGIPNTSTATSTTGLGGNEWLHVVGVRDASAGKVRIYINGVLEDEQDDLTGNLSNKQVLSIGSNSKQNTGTFFKGYVRDVRVYNRTLSVSDVNSLYAGAYLNTTGLVLWLKRDEGSGEICADSSGEGNNGTIVGASWSTYAEPTPTPTPSPKPTPNLIAVVGAAIILMMIALYSYYSLK